MSIHEKVLYTNSMDRIGYEKQTISKMISIYCDKKHGQDPIGLCNECEALKDYAFKRLDTCRYGDKKPVCGQCKTHCYKPDMQAQVKSVMKFAGPRMLWQAPIMSLRHLYYLGKYS